MDADQSYRDALVTKSEITWAWWARPWIALKLLLGARISVVIRTETENAVGKVRNDFTFTSEFIPWWPSRPKTMGVAEVDSARRSCRGVSLPSSAAPLVVLLFFAAWPALAQVRPTNKGDGYAQAGGASFGRRQVVATANAATTLFRNAATGAPQCFRVGSLGNIHASNETTTVGTAGGEFVVAFMLAPPGDITMAGDGVTTGDTDTNSACYLTDNNGPDGNGACVTLGPGERIDQVPSYDALIAQIGARLGICTLSLDIDGNPGGPVGFPACANNTDCVTDWGLTGATCDLPGDGSGLDAAGIRARMTESGCAAAVVQTDVDNSIIDWHFDQ